MLRGPSIQALVVGNNRDTVVADPRLVLAQGFNDCARLFFTERPFFLSWAPLFSTRRPSEEFSWPWGHTALRYNPPPSKWHHIGC